ncbi:MAG: hypothetical protein H8E47_12375 [Anaerolineales bacterium]|nr:hypothetical protein [Anaerolineales bacterium]
MSDIAIHVENLSKLYRIGRAQQRHDTLRDALVAAFKRPHVQTLERSNEIWALKDVSFEVQRGEVVGIPSTGSGQASAATGRGRARLLRAALIRGANVRHKVQSIEGSKERWPYNYVSLTL